MISPGILLVALVLVVTVVVTALRVRTILFRENLDGRAFLDGVMPLLEAGDREAVLAACAEVPGTAVGEVVRAAVEAAPAGREAVEQAVDEAQMDTLPEREAARGIFDTLARVCGAVGMLGAAIEIRGALSQESGVLPLAPVVLTLGGGVVGLLTALYARALVTRTVARIVDEAARAARLLPGLVLRGEKSVELSSAQLDCM